MKIRRPWLVKTLCMLGYWFIHALVATVFCKYWRFGPDFRPANISAQDRCIYVLWHEYLLVPMIRFSHSTARLLVSHHTDGLIVAEMCKHLRMGTVRGSEKHGGVEAIRRLLRPSRYRTLAVTPDGPRGPRRQVKIGVIYLAARLGWPIVPIGIGYRRPWRLRSWDRLAIPRPYERAVFVTSEAIAVPDLERDQLEAYRQKVQSALDALTERAETAAKHCRRPAVLADKAAPAKLNKAA
jgi:lysophospholipid acyltransferase (LPLAT)-like uncharacterized protein